MEPNYSRHALIRASWRSFTRGVTFAFQSPSVCFEICDNHSRLPFVTACSVWCRGKKAWPIAMQEFPCFQLKTVPLFLYFTEHKWYKNKNVCVFGAADYENMCECINLWVDTQMIKVFVCVIVLWQHRVRERSNSQSITLRGLQWLWQRGGG